MHKLYCCWHLTIAWQLDMQTPWFAYNSTFYCSLNIKTFCIYVIWEKPDQIWAKNFASPNIGTPVHLWSPINIYVSLNWWLNRKHTTDVQTQSESSSFEPVLPNNCLAALDFGAGVEQSFDCLIIQKRQAVQSMGSPMDWTFEDNMFEWFVLLRHTNRSQRGQYHMCASKSGNVRLWCGGG